MQRRRRGPRSSPGGGLGDPLKKSCLEKPMDRGAWEGCSPRGRRESDTTEWVSAHACALLSVDGGRNGSDGIGRKEWKKCQEQMPFDNKLVPFSWVPPLSLPMCFGNSISPVIIARSCSEILGLSARQHARAVFEGNWGSDWPEITTKCF